MDFDFPLGGMFGEIDLWAGMRLTWNQFFISGGWRQINVDARIDNMNGKIAFEGFVVGGGAKF